MKVAFVVPRYGDGIVGGAETLTRGLAEHLAATGAAVEVLTTCARDHLTWKNAVRPGARAERGVTVRRFRVKPRNERRFDWLQRRILTGHRLSPEDERRWAEESVSSPDLFAHLVRHRADHNVVCFAPYLFGTTLRGVPLVPERAVLIPCLHDEPFAHLGIVRASFETCRGFIFNSPPEAELARRLYGVQDRPAGVVGLGFDPLPPVDAQAIDRFRRRHGLAGPVVLYLGRKETGKNVGLLIEYVRRYREAHRREVTLVLAGEGPVTASPGDAGVRDLGYLDRQEKTVAYAAATVVCQPSLNESFSIVLMEAWLAGRPVLVHSACPVTTYHLYRADGGLVFGDFYEFAEALTLLLDDEALRGKLGAQGRAYVEAEYAWPEVTARLTETLARVCHA
ncbi:MAG TPA: glycosyltransferase family 4 protein [Methylomirabilota bacterium]|jgi:glycosyltransferase involved in cell wall biosynthesis|nr:glycosyltransferase family 4 protein [Methylomirabilota bacterium]